MENEIQTQIEEKNSIAIRCRYCSEECDMLGHQCEKRNKWRKDKWIV